MTVNIFQDFQLSSSSWEWLSVFSWIFKIFNFPVPLENGYQYFPRFSRFSTFQLLLRRTINIFLDFQDFQLSSSSWEWLSIFSKIFNFPVPLENGYQYFPGFSRFSIFQFLLRMAINIFLDFHDFQLSSSSWEGLSIFS